MIALESTRAITAAKSGIAWRIHERKKIVQAAAFCCFTCDLHRGWNCKRASLVAAVAESLNNGVLHRGWIYTAGLWRCFLAMWLRTH